MKRLHITMIIAGLAALPQSAVAASPKRPPSLRTSAMCAKLTADYEDASKSLAMYRAEGLIDNSAIRATMRETQASSTLEQARITMDLLKNHGCKSPTFAPSASRYITAAIACLTAKVDRSADESWARFDGKAPSAPTPLPACDRSTWQPAS